jgi:hypothetical protein
MPTDNAAEPARESGAAAPAPAEPAPPAMPPAPRCLDCQAPLTGPFCAQCGQRADVHVLTMREVTHDFVHSVLHLDSTVWRTLKSLVLRPGELTREFIAGRRQRYLPPFRLYLVVSLAFFALSSLLPDGGTIHVNPAGGSDVAPVQPTVTGADGGEAGSRARQAADRGQAGCAVDTGWAWLDGLLAQACARLEADGGRRIGEVFLSNAPKFMFLFLPLMAAVATLFYWRPRRLYAEHLVLFLHVHAFVFLWLIVTSLVNAAAWLAPRLAGPLEALTLALLLLLPWYVYRAMRVVYGEGPRRTVFKMAAIGTGYFFVLGLTMGVGLVYSMLSL